MPNVSLASEVVELQPSVEIPFVPASAENAVPKGAEPKSPKAKAKSASAPLSYFTHPNRSRPSIYLLRHGSAGTRRKNPKLDVRRPLDKEGKRYCLYLAHILNSLKVSFDLIVSSPLKRCLQTAQFVGTELGYENRILQTQALEPDADFAQFERLLHECRSYEQVLLVGHNPSLTAFLGHLLTAGNNGGNCGPDGVRLRLRKGSLARVTLERGPAVLQWMLDPRLVRALYDTSTKSSRRKTSRK